MPDKNIASTITGARPTDGGARPTSCRLHVVFPAELRASFRLREAETTVGRDPGLDGLVLDHGTISRRHAAFGWSGPNGAHTVRDLGSRNGTSADGVKATLSPRLLVSGSLLRLGDTLAVYEQDQSEDPAEVTAASGDRGSAAAATASRDAVPGEAAVVRRLRAAMARAAVDPAAVLILGETGTGKERIARELHRLSGRSGKLVALNCAALSAELVESQLFGHVKGAFTGAGDAQPGLFRAAHGGTLFLDEIGDLPLPLQPKLLRALQEGEVLPVGATQPVRVDVRVVAATHRNLVRAIADREFREDLYARLSIWELFVPPLRERRIDILGWIDRFHAQWAADRSGGNAATGAAAAPGAGDGGSLRFDADAAEALLRFAWPLNLRGLERLVHDVGAAGRAGSVISRAALPGWLGTAGAARPGDAPSAALASHGPPDAQSPPAPEAAREAVPTREEFTRAFEELGGSVHGLAKRFGRDRRQIYRWLEAYGLREGRAAGAGDPKDS